MKNHDRSSWITWIAAGLLIAPGAVSSTSHAASVRIYPQAYRTGLLSKVTDTIAALESLLTSPIQHNIRPGGKLDVVVQFPEDPEAVDASGRPIRRIEVFACPTMAEAMKAATTEAERARITLDPRFWRCSELYSRRVDRACLTYTREVRHRAVGSFVLKNVIGLAFSLPILPALPAEAAAVTIPVISPLQVYFQDFQHASDIFDTATTLMNANCRFYAMKDAFASVNQETAPFEPPNKTGQAMERIRRLGKPPKAASEIEGVPRRLLRDSLVIVPESEKWDVWTTLALFSARDLRTERKVREFERLHNRHLLGDPAAEPAHAAVGPDLETELLLGDVAVPARLHPDRLKAGEFGVIPFERDDRSAIRILGGNAGGGGVEGGGG